MAVIGLSRRHRQQCVQQREIQVKQKGAMKKQRALVAALRIAGELPGRGGGAGESGNQRQIGMAPDRNSDLRVPASGVPIPTPPDAVP